MNSALTEFCGTEQIYGIDSEVLIAQNRICF